MSKSSIKNVLEVKQNSPTNDPTKKLETFNASERLVAIEDSKHTYEDAMLISEAIRNKTVVIDLKKNKKYAFTNVSVIEIGAKDIKAIEMTVKQEVERFESEIKKSINPLAISTILVKLESVNAAFLESEKIDSSINKLNSILADIVKNGSEEDKKNVRNGVVSFFARSKATISDRTRTFNNGKTTLNNKEEKEYFRNDYISKMLEAGVVDYQLLVECGIITNLDFMTLDEVFRELNVLTNEEFENACYLSDSFETREDILNYYVKKDKRFFASFASLEEIIKFLKEEKIDAKTVLKRLKIDEIKKLSPELLEELLEYNLFPKGTEFLDFLPINGTTERFLNRQFLNSLNREQLITVLMSEKIKYKNSLKSEEYIDLYGTLKTEDIEKYINEGIISIEDVIKLTKFKSLKLQNPEEYKKMIELQLKTYTFENLNTLLENDKINKRFVELFNDFINSELSEEQRKEYFERIKNQITLDSKEEKFVLLVKNGINFNGINYEISSDVLEEMYIDEKISEQEILKLFESQYLSLETIKTFFSNEDLIEHYRNGLINYKVLNIIDNRAEIIKEELLKGNISSAELINLYSSSNGINIEEFLNIVEKYEFKEEGLVDFITDEITPEKIEELFKNYYISQDELSVLVERNLITKKQAQEFAEKIATQEEYDAIFEDENGFIILTEDTPEGEHTTKGLKGDGKKRANQLKIDPELQELLLEQIGFDERRPILRGTNNSLDGYRIYPSKEFALMVFLKNDKPGNATYIMSLQQGMFFLKKMARKGNIENSVIESDATKQGLRETEHVKVRNVSAGWGKNIVSEMKMLSPEFAKRITDGLEYKEVIEELINDIKNDYEDRKRDVR